jgi:UDP-N-acetylglucosamine 2-epimerase
MMKKMKVMTVVGTRPEIIRLARVMAALDKHCDHIISSYRSKLRL